MHILVSKCKLKGLNEEEFAILSTAKEKWKKKVHRKNNICVLQCYHKTILKITKKTKTIVKNFHLPLTTMLAQHQNCLCI